MSAPVTLRIVRPYSSEAELLEQEGWTVDPKGMLLIDQEALPADTIVRFDVTLADGTAVVVAEGKVVGTTAATDERPGGLRVRFKRFGASTKAFIDRALKSRNTVARKPARIVLQSLPDIDLPPAAPPAARPSPATDSDASGVHARPVSAPPDRDALLSRLRERARGLVKVADASPGADESAG